MTGGPTPHQLAVQPASAQRRGNFYFLPVITAQTAPIPLSLSSPMPSTFRTSFRHFSQCVFNTPLLHSDQTFPFTACMFYYYCCLLCQHLQFNTKPTTVRMKRGESVEGCKQQEQLLRCEGIQVHRKVMQIFCIFSAQGEITPAGIYSSCGRAGLQ